VLLASWEELVLFKANVGPQSLAKHPQPIEVSLACRVEIGAECLMIAQGSLHQLVESRGRERGEQEGFLDLEVRQQLDLVSTLHLFDQLSSRDPALEGATDLASENETLVMVGGEITELRITSHDELIDERSRRRLPGRMHRSFGGPERVPSVPIWNDEQHCQTLR